MAKIKKLSIFLFCPLLKIPFQNILFIFIVLAAFSCWFRRKFAEIRRRLGKFWKISDNNFCTFAYIYWWIYCSIIITLLFFSWPTFFTSASPRRKTFYFQREFSAEFSFQDGYLQTFQRWQMVELLVQLDFPWRILWTLNVIRF